MPSRKSPPEVAALVPAVIRLAISALPWVAAAWVLAAVRRERLAQAPGKPHRRVPGDIWAFVPAAAVALAVALALGGQVRAPDVLKLGDDTVFQMDLDRVVGVLTNYWHGTARSKVHPLQPLLMQPVAYAVQKAHVEPFRASQITCALMLALSAGLLSALLWRSTRAWIAPLLGTAMYVGSFGFLLHATVPESAAMAAPTIVFPYYLYALFRGRPLSPRETVLMAIAAILALGITVTNVAHALIVSFLRLRETAPTAKDLRRAWFRYGVLVGLAGALAAVLQLPLYPGAWLWFLPGSYLEEVQYVSGKNRLLPQTMASTALQMLCYPIAAPRFEVTADAIREGTLQGRISAENVSPARFPARSLGLISAAALLLAAAGFRARNDALARAAMLGIAANLGLHLAYGSEYLMYCGDWLALICIVPAIAAAASRALAGCAVAFMAFAVPANIAASSRLDDMMRNQARLLGLHAILGAPGTHELSRVVVAPTGSLSPGIGTYGVHFALRDSASGEGNLDAAVTRGPDVLALEDGWLPAPIVVTHAGGYRLEETVYPAVTGGAAVRLRLSTLRGSRAGSARLYLVVGNRGPAGGRAQLAYGWERRGMAATVGGVPAVCCPLSPDAVSMTDDQHAFAAIEDGRSGAQFSPMELAKHRVDLFLARLQARIARRQAKLPELCSAVMASWEIAFAPGSSRDLWFSVPSARPLLNPTLTDLSGAVASGEPGLAPLRAPAPDPIGAADTARSAWRRRLAAVSLDLPDPNWAEALKACGVQIAADIVEGGKPLPCPGNYGPYTRDGAYMVHALLVTGQFDTAARAIEYLLAHPWSGRPQAEGDTPGQLLWAIDEYYRYTGDTAWLRRHVPAIRDLASAIRRLRGDGAAPVTVDLDGQRRALRPGPTALILRKLANGLPPRLNYGTMDGDSLFYVNLVSLAGLRRAEYLFGQAGSPAEAAQVRSDLADYQVELARAVRLAGGDIGWRGNGLRAAYWPCGFESTDPWASARRARSDGRRPDSVWPYLDLDSAHNALYMGRPQVALDAVDRYMRSFSFRTWRTLDEGGLSDEGYWRSLRTNPSWPPGTAMPHGWSLASLAALIRDCLVCERADRVELLSGAPANWFAPGRTIGVSLPTAFGTVTLRLTANRAALTAAVTSARPIPGGFILKLPPGFAVGEVHLAAPGAGRPSVCMVGRR